jgi:8-oxo-dGTP diphosphatase
MDEFARPVPAPGPDGYRNPSLATDAACLRTVDGRQEILLITRAHQPSKGRLALPGGFVDYNEDPENAVLRELHEECGIDGRLGEVVCVRGDPARDPRKHVVTIVYIVHSEQQPTAGDDAATAVWYGLEECLGFADERWAFDHHAVVTIVQEKIQS